MNEFESQIVFKHCSATREDRTAQSARQGKAKRQRESEAGDIDKIKMMNHSDNVLTSFTSTNVKLRLRFDVYLTFH